MAVEARAAWVQAPPCDRTGRVGRLTTRQREVLALIAQGLSNAAIARRLFVTEKSVVQHSSNIYEALDLPPSPDEHRRVLAVLHWLEQRQAEHLGAIAA